MRDRAEAGIGVAMNVTDERPGQRRASPGPSRPSAGVDVLVSNAGIQIVHPIEDFPFEDWKKLLAIHLDGAFLTTKACIPHMYEKSSGSIIYMGSVHSKEASPLKIGLRHRQARPARAGPRDLQGRRRARRARQRHLPRLREDAAGREADSRAGPELGISEEEVVNKIMLGETVDKEFTTIEDVAEVALLFAAFPTNALTGQSLIVSHGWYMD